MKGNKSNKPVYSTWRRCPKVITDFCKEHDFGIKDLAEFIGSPRLSLEMAIRGKDRNDTSRFPLTHAINFRDATGIPLDEIYPYEDE